MAQDCSTSQTKEGCEGGGGLPAFSVSSQPFFCLTVIKLPLMITKAGRRGRPERIFLKLVLPSVCTHCVSTKHMQAPAENNTDSFFFRKEKKEMGNGELEGGTETKWL